MLNDYLFPRALAGYILSGDEKAHDELASLLVRKYGIAALTWVVEAAVIAQRAKAQAAATEAALKEHGC